MLIGWLSECGRRMQCGLVKGFNIYDLIKWNASQENIQTIKNELNKTFFVILGI